jgi:hypothetical protein
MKWFLIAYLSTGLSVANAAPYSKDDCEVLHLHLVACLAQCGGGTCSRALALRTARLEDRHHFDAYELCQRVRAGQVSPAATFHKFCKRKGSFK